MLFAVLLVAPSTTYPANPDPEDILSMSGGDLTIDEMIENTFPEKAELMSRVSFCESGKKQFYENNEPVIGPTDDWGLFQIHRPTWHKKAKEMGLDYKNSTRDNIKMARYIYDTQGISAWQPSRHCWNMAR